MIRSTFANEQCVTVTFRRTATHMPTE